MAEQPFKISITEFQLTLLRQKLELAVFPDELEGAGNKYGAPLGDIRRLATYWKDGFDWRKQEKSLNNELAQFTRDIHVEGHGTLNIHYIHKKSEVVDAIPLLFVHGWPGSFIEVRKILPLLTEVSPNHPSFHVVALSIPGYGFSEAPKKPGFAMNQYAEIGNKLMLALGYDKYVAQGGDWGMFITRKIAEVYGGKHCLAWHTNMPQGLPPIFTRQPLAYIKHILTPYTGKEKESLARMQMFLKEGMGFYAEQSTQPQTLGYSLADSPIGLLAWIYEKLVSWADDYSWTDDEVLSWVSIYWFSRAGPTASIRIHYEHVHVDGGNEAVPHIPTIPIGLSYFPKEMVITPASWRSTIGNVLFVAEHSQGGHFAAYERPKELVGDLRKMFGKGGPAFGSVPGRTGY